MTHSSRAAVLLALSALSCASAPDDGAGRTERDAGRPDASANSPDSADASMSDGAPWDGAADQGNSADTSASDATGEGRPLDDSASDVVTDKGNAADAVAAWDGAVTRTQLNSGLGKTLKMPYSTLALNMNYVALVGGLDPNYFHWCVSPIDDDQGKTHLFLSRWPARLGMAGWSSQGELAHYVADNAEGPFTYVNTALDNGTVPSSWMVSPHNVRIKKIDGSYVIIYIVQDSRVGNQRGQKIGMLISNSLNGPWTPVGPGGVVVQPSTDPGNWAYNGLLGVDNPDVDKVNGKYYVYFKSGPMMNGSMHYGYAESAALTGPYVISSAPQTDNVDYLEDATAFWWNGYEYLLTTDNFGTNTGIFGAGDLVASGLSEFAGTVSHGRRANRVRRPLGLHDHPERYHVQLHALGQVRATGRSDAKREAGLFLRSRFLQRQRREGDGHVRLEVQHRRRGHAHLAATSSDGCARPNRMDRLGDGQRFRQCARRKPRHSMGDGSLPNRRAIFPSRHAVGKGLQPDPLGCHRLQQRLPARLRGVRLERRFHLGQRDRRGLGRRNDHRHLVRFHECPVHQGRANRKLHHQLVGDFGAQRLSHGPLTPRNAVRPPELRHRHHRTTTATTMDSLFAANHGLRTLVGTRCWGGHLPVVRNGVVVQDARARTRA